MPAPSDEVRIELEGLLEQDPTKLGVVFRGLKDDLTPGQIVALPNGPKNAGIVSNYKHICQAILQGEPRGSRSVWGFTRSRIDGLVDGQNPSPDTRAYLSELAEALKAALAKPPPDPGIPVAPTQVIAALRAYRNVILEGVAGTGKSFLLDSLRATFGSDRVSVVVFHPATTYEDFVEGLRPHGSTFGVEDGAFLRLCRRAARDSEGNLFVLVIDEINRANTAKVLGDLLYSIEPSKRVSGPEADQILSATLSEPATRAKAVVLQQLRRDPEDGSRTYRQRFCVPENLLILGTMNTTDRSVGSIDLALRRRFVFIRQTPMPADELINLVPDLAEDVNTWAQLNEKLATIGPDALLGHSYFFEFQQARLRLPEDQRSLLNLWRDMLLPQVAEILIAFNCLNSVTLPPEEDTGGFTLKTVGEGLDAYPIVVSGVSSGESGEEI